MPPLATNTSDGHPIIRTYHGRQQRNEHKQRKVHFHPWVSFVTIPNISDYSKEEIASTWYSYEEVCELRRCARIESTFPTWIPSETDLRKREAASTHEVISGRGPQDTHRHKDITADERLKHTAHNHSERIDHVSSSPLNSRLVEFFQW